MFQTENCGYFMKCGQFFEARAERVLVQKIVGANNLKASNKLSILLILVIFYHSVIEKKILSLINALSHLQFYTDIDSKAHLEFFCTEMKYL